MMVIGCGPLCILTTVIDGAVISASQISSRGIEPKSGLPDSCNVGADVPEPQGRAREVCSSCTSI